MKHKVVLLTSLLLGALLIPTVAFAAGDGGMGEAQELLYRIRDMVALITIPVGTAMSAGGGLYYMISGNNPSKREEAKGIIQNVVVGGLMIVLIPNLLTWLLSGYL